MSANTAVRAPEERRMHVQLMEFWESLKHGRPDGHLPRERDINPIHLQEWWPQMFLLDIQRRDFPCRLHYSYMGDALVEACGGDLSGQPVGSLPSALAQEGLQEAAETVVSKAEPLIQDGQCLGPHGVWVHYRRILLPLTRDDQHVDYILGGVSWRLA